MGRDPRLRSFVNRRNVRPRKTTVTNFGAVAVAVVDSRPALRDLSWILIGPTDTPWAHGQGSSKQDCIRRALAARDRINAIDAAAEEHETDSETTFAWDEPSEGWVLTHYRPRGESDGDEQ